MKKILLLIVFLLLTNLSFATIDSRIDGLLDSRHWDGTDIATLALPPTTTGQNCYVSTVGNDSYNGTQPTYTSGQNGPKRNINGCLDRYGWVTMPYRILVMAGKYRETISIPETPRDGWMQTGYNKNVVIGPYGDGRVYLDGSRWDLLVGQPWTAYNGDIYKIQLTEQPSGNRIIAVVIDGNFKLYRPVDSIVNMQAPGTWYYDSATRFFYVHTSGVNPTGKDIILVDESPYGVNFLYGGSQYATIYGLTVRGFPGSAYFGGGHITFDHLIFEFNGKGFYSTNLGYNHFVSNIIRGNVLTNWPRGNSGWCQTDGGWPNAGGSDHPYAIYARNITFDNGGEATQNGDNAEICDNIFVDNFRF